MKQKAIIVGPLKGKTDRWFRSELNRARIRRFDYSDRPREGYNLGLGVTWGGPTQEMGALHGNPDKLVFATYHPSQVLRRRSLLREFREHLMVYSAMLEY